MNHMYYHVHLPESYQKKDKKVLIYGDNVVFHPCKNLESQEIFHVVIGLKKNTKVSSQLITTWNPKQPFINGCFNWMIPNLYIENGCFTKHPFINGWPWGSR